MELEELREIILSCEHVVEVHKNDFQFIGDYVSINDVMTLHNISRIHTVGDEKTNDITVINVWFNSNCIHLSDIKSLRIGRTRSYLK